MKNLMKSYTPNFLPIFIMCSLEVPKAILLSLLFTNFYYIFIRSYDQTLFTCRQSPVRHTPRLLRKAFRRTTPLGLLALSHQIRTRCT
jgi:hypothetical protein